MATAGGKAGRQALKEAAAAEAAWLQGLASQAEEGSELQRVQLQRLDLEELSTIGEGSERASDSPGSAAAATPTAEVAARQEWLTKGRGLHGAGPSPLRGPTGDSPASLRVALQKSVFHGGLGAEFDGGNLTPTSRANAALSYRLAQAPAGAAAPPAPAAPERGGPGAKDGAAKGWDAKSGSWREERDLVRKVERAVHELQTADCENWRPLGWCGGQGRGRGQGGGQDGAPKIAHYRYGGEGKAAAASFCSVAKFRSDVSLDVLVANLTSLDPAIRKNLDPCLKEVELFRKERREYKTANGVGSSVLVYSTHKGGFYKDAYGKQTCSWLPAHDLLARVVTVHGKAKARGPGAVQRAYLFQVEPSMTVPGRLGYQRLKPLYEGIKLRKEGEAVTVTAVYEYRLPRWLPAAVAERGLVQKMHRLLQGVVAKLSDAGLQSALGGDVQEGAVLNPLCA